MSYLDEWGRDIHPTTSLESRNYSLFPELDDLKHGIATSNTILISLFQEIRQLKEENRDLQRELKEEIRDLKRELKEELTTRRAFNEGMQSLKASEGFPYLTLSPSVVTTSADYAGGTAIRPSHYPPSILWNALDARSDPNLVLNPKNPTRIPMVSALRHEDGSIVDSTLYKVIRASGLSVVENVLMQGIPKHVRGPNRRWTKTFFKNNCGDIWDKAIHQYEKEQPLLRLCAGHWKADHMLVAILANKEHKQGNKQMAKATSKTQQKNAGDDEVITTSEWRPRNCVVEDEEYETGEASKLGECRNGVHYNEDEDVEEDELLITERHDYRTEGTQDHRTKQPTLAPPKKKRKIMIKT